MNYLEILIPTEIIQAIGWTLIHSLWQGIAIALFLAVLMYVMRKKEAKWRYATSIMSIMTFAVAVIATFLIEYQSYSSLAITNEGQAIETIEAGSLETITVIASPMMNSNELINYFNENLPLFVMVWLLGMFLCALRFLGEITLVYHLKNRGTQLAPKKWQDKLEVLSSKMGLERVVQLKESLRINSPMVVGTLKPVILVPLGMLSNLSPDQVESILAHELAHVKRHDFLVNMLQSFLEVIFFFNPGMWWISSNIRRERENCCDDMAIQVTGDKATFVRTLAALEEIRMSNSLALAFSKNPKGVLYRIQRILNKDKSKPFAPRGLWSGIFLFGIFTLFAFNVEKAVPNEETITSPEEVLISKMDEVAPIELISNQKEQPTPKAIVNNDFSEKGEKVKNPRALELKSIQSLSLPVSIPKVTLDTVPEKVEDETELLERRIEQLRESQEHMEKAYEEIGESEESIDKMLEDRYKDFELAKAKMHAEIAQLKQQSSSEIEEMKKLREIQMEKAMEQLAKAKEMMALKENYEIAEIKEKTRRNIAKRMEELASQKQQLEKDKDQLSKEDYEQKKTAIEESMIKLEKGLAMAEGQMEVVNAEMMAEMEARARQLEEQRAMIEKEMNINFEQIMADKQKALEQALAEFEKQRLYFEKEGKEEIRREMLEHRKHLKEEMQMMKLELEILEKELSNRKREE